MNQNNTNHKVVTVVDIGTTKIVVLIGEKENNQVFRILGFSYVTSKGVRRGNVVNIISTVESIKKAISIAEEQANVKVSNVYVGIAGQNIRTIVNSTKIVRQNANEIVTKKEIEDLIKQQFLIPVNHDEKILEVIPKYICIDDNDIQNIDELIGCIGKEIIIKFNIVIAKQQNIKSIENCIENAGLKLNRIFLEPLASSRAVLYQDEINKGVVMIDIGGGTSDLAIYYKGMLLHTAVIPFGGNVITNDIEKSFNLTYEDAEYLKKNFAQAIVVNEEESKQLVINNKIEEKEPTIIDSNLLAKIVNARMEEILGFIDDEITNISGIKNKSTFDVVVTGGGSMLKYLNQLIKYQLSMDARVGYPNIYLKKDVSKNFINPQFSTAIGLMMLAWEEAYETKDHKPFDKYGINESLEKTQQNSVNRKIPKDETTEVKKEEKKDVKSKKSKLINIFSDIFKNTDTEL